MLLGSLDECTSWLGLAKVTANVDSKTAQIEKWLLALQEMMFITQAEVATIAFDYGKYEDKVRNFPYVKQRHTQECEAIIGKIDQELPVLKSFILPGGCELVAQCDIARTIARKAERYAVISTRTVKFSAELLAFLNRLSSVLFALGRYANFIKGIKEENPTY